MTSIPSEQDRADYIAGLRLYTSLLVNNPDMPLPHAGRRGRPNGFGTIRFGNAETLLPILGRPHQTEIGSTGQARAVWHLAGLSIAADISGIEQEVVGVRMVGGREVPFYEDVIPAHLRPETADEKAQAQA